MSDDTLSLSNSILRPLDVEDEALYEAACEVIRRRFEVGRHHVGAAVRTRSRKIYAAVHLQGVIGEPAVCAEKIAIGRAMTVAADPIARSVAVRHPKAHERDGQLFVLPPCGSCRELIGDYGGPECWVILDVDGRLAKARIADLLPFRRWSRGASPPR